MFVKPETRRGLEEYIEFELDADMLREVEALAREANCTPFEICVQLLKEKMESSGLPE